MAPKTQTDAPKAQAPVVVTPSELVVEASDPVLGDDGRVYVNDAISQQAVAAGYAPDAQPRSADASIVPGKPSKKADA